MVNVYLTLGRGVTKLESTADVVSVSGRVIHTQTPAGVWLCGKTPKNNVMVYDHEQHGNLNFQRCPKCAAGRSN